MTEVRPTAKELADLVHVMEYLRERERELQKYSDKLRRSVNRIFNIFGDDCFCQICDHIRSEDTHWIYYYHHPETRMVHRTRELPQYEGWKIEFVREYFDARCIPEQKVLRIYKNPKETHQFIPKIKISLHIRDTEPFYTQIDETIGTEVKYSLALYDKRLCICEETVPKCFTYLEINRVSRAILKQLIRSGRLLKFVELIKTRMDTETKEYKEVAEIAEKIANAL